MTPLCANDPFMDAWSNPLLMRGIPKNQQDMIDRAHSRSTCPTYSGEREEKPFYLSVSGNKNPVLPNTLFDTIHEAEESGGVTRRHLTSTSRYGLSERCDARFTGGDLPAPPQQDATLRPSKRSAPSSSPLRLLTLASTSRTIRAQTLMAKKMSSTMPAFRGNATMPVPNGGRGAQTGGYSYTYDEHSSDEEN
jgi:hypothetical protein